MLEELVDHRSGLLGISRAGSDMRQLHEVASSNADARLAIQLFCYSARKQVAAMIAALGGVDLLVVTGGIGENDVEARAAIYGSEPVPGKSHQRPCIALRVASLALARREQIARHTRALFPRNSE